MAPVRIGIPRERRAGEKRVAASPDMVKKLTGMGVAVAVESGAGAGALMSDQVLAEAGAEIVPNAKALYSDADLVLKVQRPLAAHDGIGGEGKFDEVKQIRKDAILVGLLDPFADLASVGEYARRGLVSFAMELIPRISRAQAMDALSSQSNIAGYKAVIEAAAVFTRIFPMMMTAAGSIAPARVLVLGAGVAGLQAIATARRLGGVVSAFDVRPVTKEQVESLGAKFIEISGEESGETAAGYAKEMSLDYQQRQSALIHETLKKTDIVIATALIPGKPVPRLISDEMLRDMRPGSVVVDLAAGAGGNCAGAEADRITRHHGVTIIGPTDLPSRVAIDTSSLYARNLLSFVGLLINPETGAFAIDWEDEIVKGALLTRGGEIVHPALKSKPA